MCEREWEREREKERGRETERDVEYGCFILIFKGMTGALAPFSYLVIYNSLCLSVRPSRLVTDAYENPDLLHTMFEYSH